MEVDWTQDRGRYDAGDSSTARAQKVSLAVLQVGPGPRVLGFGGKGGGGPGGRGSGRCGLLVFCFWGGRERPRRLG